MKKFVFGKRSKILITAVFLVVLIYALGPRPKITEDKQLPKLEVSIENIETYIDQKERKVKGLKPDNESEIIWADQAGVKTKYSIVYLHGWSASKQEGAPVHYRLAETFGANLYLPRLYAHGIEKQVPFEEMTADKLIQSAKEAIAYGQLLGEELILVSTSTGGSLALYLASEIENLKAVVLYSPNIQIYSPTAKILDNPWGAQIAKKIQGSDQFYPDVPQRRKPFWNDHYAVSALPELQAFLSTHMNKATFKTVEEPLFLGYYYKNEEEQDKVVSVDAMLEMYEQIATPESKKYKVAFSEAGNHIIASPLASAAVEEVYQETAQFLINTVGLVVASPTDNKRNNAEDYPQL